MEDTTSPPSDRPLHFGVWLELPPGAGLTGHGISHLLMELLRVASARRGVTVTVACAPWTQGDLARLLADYEVREGAIEILTTGRAVPVALRASTPEGPGSRGWGERLWSWARRVARSPEMHRLVTRALLPLAATDSESVHRAFRVLLAIVAVPLALAGAAVWAATGLLSLPRRLMGRLERSLDRGSLGVRLVRRACELVRNGSAPLRSLVLENEFTRLARIACERPDIGVWYVPIQTSQVPGWGSKPLVIAVPDVVYLEFPTLFEPGWQTVVDERIRIAVSRAAATISYSEHVRTEHVVKHLQVPRERTFVIPHGHAAPSPDGGARADRSNAWARARRFLESEFELSSWQETHRLAEYVRGFPFDEVDFVFVSSQIRPHKNLKTIVRAVEILLRERHVDLKLVTTGVFDDGDPGLRELLLERHLLLDVLSIARMPPDVHEAFYRLARLTVVPTLFEGAFPFPFSESMAAGTPVVMSSIPITRATVPSHLWERMLFDPCDPEDCARRIQYGLEHGPELHEAQRPLHEALARRTWDHVLDETLSVLQQAAGDRVHAEGRS